MTTRHVSFRRVFAVVALTFAGQAFAAGEVYRAKANVTTEGDGQSWTSPMSLTNALASAAATGGEVWLEAATFNLTVSTPTFTPAAAAVIRGGFAGTETAPEQRAAAARTTLNGGDLYNTLTVNAAKTIEIERLILTHSLNNGLKKTGGWTFTARDCAFDENGWKSPANVNGRGAYVESGTCYFTNCVFRRNYDTVGRNYIGTAGLHCFKASRVYVDNCLFEQNGYVGKGQWNPCSTLYTEETPITMRHTVFRGNRSLVDQGSGLVRLSRRGDNSVISHCLFIANEAVGSGGCGIFNVDYYNGVWGGHNHHIDFDNCTFAYNVSRVTSGATALTVYHGIVTVKNCIFWGNVAGSGSSSGVDVSVTGSDGNCTVSYCLFGDDAEHAADHYKAVSGTLTADTGIVYGDPLFVSPLADFQALLKNPATVPPKATDASPAFAEMMTNATHFAKIAALDVHLKSSAGYFDNAGVEHKAAGLLSPGIDTGDGDVGAEPSPNGGLLNLGVYGGTAEASKTPTSEPGIDGNVTIGFLSKYTQPTVSFTVGGSGGYTGSAVVYLTTNGTDWCHVSATIGGLQIGQQVAYLVPAYYPTTDATGCRLTAKVVLTGAGAMVDKSSVPTDIVGELPPWHGKGGDPNKVLHVRAGATGRRDGTSWTDAYTDLDEAILAVTDARNEIWTSVDIVRKVAHAGYTITKPLTLRGGFTGTENSPAERHAGSRTLIDGADIGTCLSIFNSAAVTIDRFRLTRGKEHGFVKSASSGDLTLVDCDIVGNGGAGTFYESWDLEYKGGLGAFFQGNDLAKINLTNCVFGGNCATNPGGGSVESMWIHRNYGAGALARNCARLTMDSCLFATNGSYGCFRSSGSRGLQATDTPVTARGCRFVGHNARAWQGGCGAAVYLYGQCADSAFTNCLWSGNSASDGANGSGCCVYGLSEGALLVNLSEALDAVSVQNCTFAYNVCHSSGSAAGLTVNKGAVRVRDSIFFANAVGGATTNGADIACTSANGSVDVDYTLFGDEGAGYVSGAAAAVGANCVYGDPQLVSTFADFTNTTSGVMTPVTRAGRPYIKKGAMPQAASFNVHLRGRCGYYDASGRWTRTLRGKSPALDAGDPATPYANEPDTELGGNGGRVNLGCYGNTPYATLSPVRGAVLRVR